MNAPDPVLQHLAELGLDRTQTVYYNLSPARLVELSVRRGEGRLTDGGPLATRTDPHTGRSPNDRFVVREPSSEDDVAWGATNKPVSEETFDGLLESMKRYATGRDVFVRDCYAGADPRYRVKVRVITEKAWHSMFAYNMFLRPATEAELVDFEPDYTVLDLCDFKATEKNMGELNSSTFVLLNLGRGLVLIGGTNYAGEIKKSIFSALNYVLPGQGVLPMHCSANEAVGGGNTAIFFGLSGTGKTTLSADASRVLIGDDEHGWSDEGVFNFEGGCYAKAIRLSPEGEPEIFATTQEFGTLAENVALRPDRSIDFDDATITENTRLSYPISVIPNASADGMGGVPETVVFLTADAFGVLTADLEADATPGDVPLPERLHGQGGRDRARRDRAQGDVLGLLWRAVHGAPADTLRRDAGRAHRADRRPRLPRQHRLDGRPVRDGRAHEAGLDAPHGQRRAGGRTGRRRDGDGAGLRPPGPDGH